MRYVKIYFIFFIFLLFLAGCATGIRIKVLKPAEINMSGARKLAIFSVDVPKLGGHSDLGDLWKDTLLRVQKKPFAKTSVEYKIAEYATDNLISSLVNTDYFEIISPTDVERSIEFYENDDIDPIMLGQLLGAEAIIISEITDLEEDVESFTVIETVMDKDTKEEYEIEVPWMRKIVYLRFTYWVISTATDTLIATKSFHRNTKDEVEAGPLGADFKSSEQMYRQIINGILPGVAMQLAPYEVWEARYMMKDKTKDPRMKEADNLVKGGIYEKALDLFLEIWYDNQNPAAGVNAAIMHEALGDVDSALEVIEAVLDVSADKKVMYEYKRLQKVKEDLEELEKQMGG